MWYNIERIKIERRDWLMDRRQIIILLIAIIAFSISGCRSIYVGGSGKIGDATGSGEINIPVPQKELESQ